MADMFVVIEWNQASGRPALAGTEVYDSAAAAEEYGAAPRRALNADVGRRERYTVHAIEDEPWGAEA